MAIDVGCGTSRGAKKTGVTDRVGAGAVLVAGVRVQAEANTTDASMAVRQPAAEKTHE
jgi:hypothetical protein